MATMQRISKETETKLVRSLEKVANLVQGGEIPNDAIIKVAHEDDLPIGHVQLMVQAYNNSRFNQQRKSSSLVAEKTAHFPLAEPKDIYERLYPTNVKEAQVKMLRGPEISDEYTRSPERIEPDKFSMPHFTKAAEELSIGAKPLQREQSYYVKKAHSLIKELDVEHAEKRRLMNAARDKVAEAFDDLSNYFKRSYHLPYNEVKEASVALYGPQAGPVFDHLSDLMPKLVNDRSGHYKVAVDRSQPPYTMVEKCLIKVSEYLVRFNDLGKFSKEAGAATANLMEQFMPLQRIPLKGSLLQHKGVEKQALDASMLSGPISSIGSHVLGHALAQQVMKGVEPKAPEALERKSLLQLMDPAHEQKLRGIRAQATYHDLMANDEFLQGADPAQATKLYNEIAKVSPRAVDQPLLMRALLRRYIAQGNVDPSEVNQLAEIEGKLKERETPIAPQPTFAKQE